MTEENLENVLQEFEKCKDMFRLPLTLSYEHDDVTVKYIISMLRIQPNINGQIINSFCERFNVDHKQMKELISSSHNWCDYMLYSVFSFHCQQQLKMDETSFFKTVVEKTFLNPLEDFLIKLAPAFELEEILKKMPSQFRNWSRVNDIITETARARYYLDENCKVKKENKALTISLSSIELSKFTLLRRTKEKTRQRIRRLGNDIEALCLKRDCDYTLYSFTNACQKLFGQKDLLVERIKTEADGYEWSEYTVIPSQPYLTLFKRIGKSISQNLKHVYPRSELKVCKKRLEKLESDINLLKDEAFDREQIIQANKTVLEQKNASLERYQELLVNTLQKLSSLSFSGERHSIRNYLHSAGESEKAIIINKIAEYIHLMYSLVRENSILTQHLAEICSPFNIIQDTLNNRKELESILYNVHIAQSSGEDKKTKTAEQSNSEPIEDIFGIFDREVEFDSAYRKFLAIKEEMIKAQNITNHPLESFDPFILFKTYATIKEVTQRINTRLDNIGEFSLLEDVTLEEAVTQATKISQEEKNAKLNVHYRLEYNPQLNTPKELLITKFKEIIYNSIRAKATELKIISKNPLIYSDLPFIRELSLSDYPQLYIRIEDNGIGIPKEQLGLLNEILIGNQAINPESVSTKEKDETGKATGGVGTQKLREYLSLHFGKAIYEPAEKGTKLHIYLGRLNILPK